VKGIFDGITTAELDEYTANYASTLAAEHPDFAVLAGRIAVSNLQKQTSKVFSEAMSQLYGNVDPITGTQKPLIAKDVYGIVMDNKEVR
jgi:ribonucleoside-diphosphate reductase alpha chain